MPRKPPRKTAASRKPPRHALPRKTKASVSAKTSSAKPKTPVRRSTAPADTAVAEPVIHGVGFPVVGVGASAGGLEAFTLIHRNRRRCRCHHPSTCPEYGKTIGTHSSG